MKLSEFRQKSLLQLANASIDKTEAKIELNILIETILNLTPKDLILKGDFELSTEKINQLENMINQRIKTKQPIQYIIGLADFMGEKFFVDENVLIPRPETEILVQETIQTVQEIKEPVEILDIGTGSGCIACSLAKNLKNVNVTAVDISENALKIAQKNANFLNVNINLIHSNLFENIKEKFHIIVSNPPYIPISEKETLQAEVSEHEPGLALFTKDKKGMEFYDKIIEQAPKYLFNGGFLFFEIGIYQMPFILEKLSQEGFSNIEITKDLSNIERVIKAQYLKTSISF